MNNSSLYNNHIRLQLPNGDLHVYANEFIYNSLEGRIFEMADNNLQIPHHRYMSYTPDVHVGEGTCIGTTAVWDMADGYISPSIVGSDIGCGMRVHRTNLHAEELRDPQLRRKLVKEIGKRLPAEDRRRGEWSDIRLEDVVVKGLHGLPRKYMPDVYTPKKSTSLSHVEHAKFSFDREFLERLPDKFWHRGHRQLGTLGSGNHFCEIQTIEIAAEQRELARQWGLFDGQVVVMIHSGSRAWGGLIGSDARAAFIKYMRAHKLASRDPKLLFAPIDSDVGRMYLARMYSALNYAVANRHMIAYSVHEAFSLVFGGKFQMPVLYDLMHNYALEEEHEGRRMLVHRKGATRALPAGHPDNPGPYAATGHPALIPGSMGTASFIMVGKQAGQSNYYSICHGAGRLRSRSATKRLISVEQFAAALGVGTDNEIIVNQRALESILDECPQAYKDVDQIIDSVTGAGLADVVARCRPLAVVKGV